jgi:hypothetical protein
LKNGAHPQIIIFCIHFMLTSAQDCFERLDNLVEETTLSIEEACSNPNFCLYLELRERINGCAERLNNLKKSMKENEELEMGVREMARKASKLGLMV